MIKLKALLKEEKSGNPFIDFLLIKIQPIINEIVKHYEDEAKQKGEKFSDFAKEVTELTLKYDLLKALGNYTKPTDKLKKGSVSKSNKGSLTIDAIIERDGVEYPLYTEVIYAGGYNIQRLHFRYLTKTKLPKLSSNPEADKVKAQLAKLSKGEKLEQEIQRNEKTIKYNQNLVDTNSKLNDKEIIKIVSAPGYGRTPEGGWFASQLTPYKWDELSDDQRERFGNKVKMEKYNKEMADDAIEYWKKRNIQWPGDTVKTAKENIVKAQKKLDALANS